MTTEAEKIAAEIMQETREWWQSLEKRAKLPRPKLICRDGRIIADAVVIVSPKDPNWYRLDHNLQALFNGEIRVRAYRPTAKLMEFSTPLRRRI